MRIADLQIGSSETKIENIDGYIKFTDKTNSSGKLISEITPSADRYTEPDEYTYIHWKLDEETAPYANSGTAGTLNLTTVYGAPETYRISPFGNGNCIFFNNACLSTGNTSMAPGNIYTVNFWYYPIDHQAVNANGNLITKNYSQTSWNPPFYAIFCYVEKISTNSIFSIKPGITTSGGIRTESSVRDVKTVIPLMWNMVTITYDGSNLRTYINGNLVDAVAKSGNVDYGNNGPWSIGNNLYVLGVEYIIGVLSDIRIETTVRSDSYILNMYRKAMCFVSDLTTPSQFTPESISDNVLWLRSDVGLYQDSAGTIPVTSASDPVKCWKDQSVTQSSYTTSSAGLTWVDALATANNKPAVNFNGATFLSSSDGYEFSTTCTIFAVWSSSRSTPYQRVISGTAINWLMGVRNDQNGVSYWGGGGFSGTYAYTANNVIIQMVEQFSTTGRQWVNGNVIAGDTVPNAPGRLTISSADPGLLTGNILEVICYNRQLTSHERIQIESYLKYRYGITTA